MSNEYTNAPRGATSDATDLDELERVVAEATAGRWSRCGDDRGGCKCGLIWSDKSDRTVASTSRVGDEEGPNENAIADARAIVALHNAWPSLLAELRALRAVRDAARVVEQHTARWIDSEYAAKLDALTSALSLAAPEVPRG